MDNLEVRASWIKQMLGHFTEMQRTQAILARQFNDLQDRLLTLSTEYGKLLEQLASKEETKHE
jgi:uncharacterized protein (DUF3084 family)